MGVNSRSLAVDLAGLILQNPITTASGTFGYGQEFEDFLNLDDLGAITLKSITKEPQEGNPPPRLLETPAGLMNSIGLANCGADRFVKEKLPMLKGLKRTKIIANIAGHRLEENLELAEVMQGQKRVDAVELNISCPNVDAGGLAFCFDLNLTRMLVKEVKARVIKPLIVKLSASVPSVVELAEAVVDSGADILSLINTIPAMEIDLDRRKPYFKRVFAGLSGPAIRPIALKAVYEIRKNFSVPIIGMGGIATIEDILKFLIVGADAVSVGMMNFVNPQVSVKLVTDLADYLQEQKLSLKELKQSLA